MYTPGTNLCNKIFHIEKPIEINIHRNNRYVSDLSRQVEILSIVTPYQQLIPYNNKMNKTPDS